MIASPYGFVAAAEEVVFQFNSAGQIQPNSPAVAAQIYSNYELAPQTDAGLGTYYAVTFFDQNGARLNKSPLWWQFTQTANSTVDISQMTPYETQGNVIYYPIPLTPAASVPGITVNLLTQTGSIDTVIYTAPVRGLYQLVASMVCTVTGTGNVGQAVTYTNSVAQRTITGSTTDFVTLGNEADDTFTFYCDAWQTVSYITSYTTTGTYEVHLQLSLVS